MAPLVKELDRCNFYYRDGRRCRMLKVEGHPEFCFEHWQRGEQQDAAERCAALLIGPQERLDSARAINQLLERIMRAVAQGRLPERRGTALAYLCQLSLQSLPHVERQSLREAALQAHQADNDCVISPGFDQSVRENIAEQALHIAKEEGRVLTPQEIQALQENAFDLLRGLCKTPDGDGHAPLPPPPEAEPQKS